MTRRLFILGSKIMEQVKIHGWNGYRFKSKSIEMTVVPDIGGRIISLSIGGQEIFFIQKEYAGQVFDFSSVPALRAEKKRLGFRFWGGDKTWVAPQKDWWDGIPPLELDAGCYQARLDEDAITMISPICRETGLQIIRQVSLDHDGVIHLEQEITNKGTETVFKGIWNVTQLARPFDIYLPTTKSKLRSYHEEDLTLPHHQIVVEESNGWCRIPCHDRQLFKFGGMVDMGAIVSLKKTAGGTLAFVKTFDIDIDADYVHRSAVEIFNAFDHDYLEVETHASKVCLKPGMSCRHSQKWRLKQFAGDVTPDEAFEQMTGSKYHKS
jgi:hypothetical protein